MKVRIDQVRDWVKWRNNEGSLIGCVDYLGVRSEEVYLMWSLGKFYAANLMYFFKFAWNVFKQHQYTEVHLRVRYSLSNICLLHTVRAWKINAVARRVEKVTHLCTTLEEDRLKEKQGQRKMIRRIVWKGSWARWDASKFRYTIAR